MRRPRRAFRRGGKRTRTWLASSLLAEQAPLELENELIAVLAGMTPQVVRDVRVSLALPLGHDWGDQPSPPRRTAFLDRRGDQGRKERLQRHEFPQSAIPPAAVLGGSRRPLCDADHTFADCRVPIVASSGGTDAPRSGAGASSRKLQGATAQSAGSLSRPGDAP